MTELLPLQEALARAQELNVFDTVRLTLPEYLEPIEYYCVGQQVQVLDNSVGWWRADLALRIKTDFPDNYKEVWRQFLPRYEWYTLENDARTAMRYTPEERWRWTVEDGLSYSHLQKASHLDPPEYREDVLQQARDLEWTVRQLENYLATGSPNRDALPPPSRDVQYVREKWRDWLTTITDMGDHSRAVHYTSLFLDWLESSQ